MNSIPTFSNGFAKSSGESKNPNLWKGLAGAWLPYLGKQGEKLYDWSGFGNHGALTNMNNDSWVPGKQGYELNFIDSSGQQVIIGDEIYSSHTRGTISVWFLHTTPSTYATVFGVGTTSTTGYMIIDLDPTQKLRVVHNPDNDTFSTLQGSSLAANKLYNVTLTGEGNKWRVFINGTEETMTVVAGTNNGSWFNQLGTIYTHTYQIGAVNYNGGILDYFDGNIGTVILWDRVLKDNEITQLYQNTYAPFELIPQFSVFPMVSASPSIFNLNPLQNLEKTFGSINAATLGGVLE